MEQKAKIIELYELYRKNSSVLKLLFKDNMSVML